MTPIRLLGLTLILATAALVAVPADAQQCGTVRHVYRAPVYHAPAYVAPVVHHAVREVLVTQYVAVPVPVYAIGYTPHAPGQESLQLQLDIAKLQLEVEKLKRLPLSNQGSSPQQPPNQPPQALPQKQGAIPEGGKLLVAKCAACHDVATKGKGGGLALSQGGEVLAMSGDTQARVMKELYSGRMPKGSKLSDEEVGAIFGFLDSK